MEPGVKSVILRVAQSLFSHYGFRKTSMDEIARGAHIGKATIYHYFSGKEEIFATVVNQESESLMQALELAVDSEQAPKDKIRAFVQTRVLRLRELGNLNRVSDETLSELMPMIEEARQAYFKQEVHLLQSVLEEGQKVGCFHLEQPRLVALVLLSALKGLDILFFRIQETPDISEGINEAINLFIRGLAQRS